MEIIEDSVARKATREDLVRLLDTYDSVHVPDLANVMEQFKNKTIYIYGAGCYGAAIYQTFSKYGVQVDTFLDIKSKPGDKLYDIPMYRADDELIRKRNKEDIVVVTAIVKDYDTRMEIFDFIKQCGFKTIVDAQSIRCHSVYFDNMEAGATISDHIEKQKNSILKCLDLFSDDDSKAIYITNVMAHIGRKYADCIESIGSIQYCPDDIKLHKGYKRFIDCGGYIGDTIDQIMKINKEIHAAAIFEPDMDNFSILSKNMDNYVSQIPELYLFPCAVSNNTQILFMESLGGSSTLNSENKENCVQCVSLDDVLKNFGPTFIKMDVEGEEKKTIIGAEKIIKKNCPDLAICVYHCVNHLWDIALLIDSWNLGYQFYLRTHNSFTMETVLYATCNLRGKEQ